MYFNQAPQKLQTNKSANTEKQQPVRTEDPVERTSSGWTGLLSFI